MVHPTVSRWWWAVAATPSDVSLILFIFSRMDGGGAYFTVHGGRVGSAQRFALQSTEARWDVFVLTLLRRHHHHLVEGRP